jgi:hypothetical protein
MSLPLRAEYERKKQIAKEIGIELEGLMEEESYLKANHLRLLNECELDSSEENCSSSITCAAARPQLRSKFTPSQ